MIPEFVKPFLWSYNLSALDLGRDKKRIITNVLNLGTKEATDWLISIYGKDDILDALNNPLRGEWNKKSLAYWCLLYQVPFKEAVIRDNQ